MRRRDFIIIAACGAAARPLPAAAQQSSDPPRIAIAIPAGNAEQMVREDGLATSWPGFLSELRRLGYIEGTNLIVERYSAEGQRDPERLDAFVTGIWTAVLH
jgi:putative ABC transport system substrate-binding protein